MRERQEVVKHPPKGRLRLTVVTAVGMVLMGTPVHPVAAASTSASTALSVEAVADATVRADRPTTSYGTRTTLEVDGDPVRQSFVKFSVAGVSGRTVSRVRLRLHQVDASPAGGRVFALSSNAWTESVSWDSRPAVDGPQVGAFPSVVSGTWYEAELPTSAVRGDGAVSFMIDSTHSNGADWSSRDSSNPPALLIDLAADAPPVAPASRLTTVAGSSEASSDPTYYGNAHRLAETSRGRSLTVHGRHATGVQLAWKDDGDAVWSRATTGSVLDGLLLSGTGTGDWPASIAVVHDARGQQSAVVVWSGQNFGVVRPLQMRVLTDLDAAGGPTVGPVVTLRAPALGTARADVGVETGEDGAARVVVAWSERTADASYAVMAGWLEDHLSAEPRLTSMTPLLRDTSSARSASVVSTPRGARVAARADGGRLRVYGHDTGSASSEWWSSGLGAVTPTGAYPSALGLESGEVLVTSVRDLTLGSVTVQRFPGAGQTPTTETEISGYAHPGVTAAGGRTRLVAVRVADGAVVSRSAGAGAWTTADRVEVGPEGGGNHAWPSLSPSAGARLRFVVRGPSAAANRSAVLAYERDAV